MTFSTGQVTVAATATSIAPARLGRKKLRLVNHGTTAVYVGIGSGILTTTGALLAGVAGATLEIEDCPQEVFAIVAASTQVISVIEIF